MVFKGGHDAAHDDAHDGQLLVNSVVQSILSEDEGFVLDDDGFEDFIEDV